MDVDECDDVVESSLSPRCNLPEFASIVESPRESTSARVSALKRILTSLFGTSGYFDMDFEMLAAIDFKSFTGTSMACAITQL